MSSPDSAITHVSDTALMVAACRALELNRPDGIAHDPFAERLAGERGMAIARSIPRLPIMCFGIAIRTRFMDDLIYEAVRQHGVRTVLCLGAGLDSRPWRLDLPTDLHWIEVDFQDMLDYKGARMAAEQPRCRLERIAADLTDEGQRRAVLAAVGPAPALMITEGLLMYLPAPTVEALAVEPPASSGVQLWLMDVASPAFVKAIQQNTIQSIEDVRASDHLDGAQILAVLERTGWTTLSSRSYITDLMTTVPQRVYGLIAEVKAAGVASPPPPLAGDFSGIHMFRHNAA